MKKNLVNKCFDKVIGYESLKLELTKLLDIINNPKKYERYGTSIPKNFYMSGRPGLGKTLIADCFMNGCNRNKYIIRKNEASDTFIEKMKETFAKAIENAPSVILLDDMDKYANSDRNLRDCAEYVAIQALIDGVEPDKVFVLATINDLNKLPESLVRAKRFDRGFNLRPLSGIEYKILIKQFLLNKKIADDVNLDVLNRLFDGCSCAEIESILNYAGLDAGFKNNNKLDIDSIFTAYYHIKNKRDQVEVSNYYFSYEDKLRVSYHEAGHTFLGYLFNHNTIKYCALDFNGTNYDGITEYTRNINDSDGDFRIRRIMIFLAGKATTEVIYGENDNGSYSDISGAYRNLNMDIIDNARNGFLEECDDEKPERIENIKSFELNRIYNNTKKIILNNIETVKEIGEKLAEKEYLLFPDIEGIINKHKIIMPNIL